METGFEWTFQWRFLIALALGFLVGAERERAGTEARKPIYSGVRTYTAISLYGCACAWLHYLGVVWMLPVGMMSVTALAVVQYMGKQRSGWIGWTSESALLLTFVIGALTIMTDIWISMALGIVLTTLLSEKAKIEYYLERLDQTEFLAVLRFLIVSVIILPILPNQDYTRYHLNPHAIWRIVVLVSAVGFAGYWLIKKYGGQVGLWLSGILGGVVSSTATSVAAGRIAQKNPEHTASALQACLFASSVMYLRILALVSIIHQDYFRMLGPKMAILSAVGFLLAFFVKGSDAGKHQRLDSSSQNPFEIRPALIFAAIFTALSVATVFVQERFGEAGLYWLAGTVGVVDIDPFVLSLAARPAGLSATVISAAMILAMMSNTVAKGIYFSLFARHAFKSTIWRYLLWALLHLPVALLF